MRVNVTLVWSGEKRAFQRSSRTWWVVGGGWWVVGGERGEGKARSFPQSLKKQSISLPHPERVWPQLLHDGRGAVHPLCKGGGRRVLGSNTKNTRSLARPFHTRTHTHAPRPRWSHSRRSSQTGWGWGTPGRGREGGKGGVGPAAPSCRRERAPPFSSPSHAPRPPIPPPPPPPKHPHLCLRLQARPPWPRPSAHPRHEGDQRGDDAQPDQGGQHRRPQARVAAGFEASAAAGAVHTRQGVRVEGGGGEGAGSVAGGAGWRGGEHDRFVCFVLGPKTCVCACVYWQAVLQAWCTRTVGRQGRGVWGPVPAGVCARFVVSVHSRRNPAVPDSAAHAKALSLPLLPPTPAASLGLRLARQPPRHRARRSVGKHCASLARLPPFVFGHPPQTPPLAPCPHAPHPPIMALRDLATGADGCAPDGGGAGPSNAAAALADALLGRPTKAHEGVHEVGERGFEGEREKEGRRSCVGARASHTLSHTQLPGVGPTTRPGFAPPPGSVQAAALAAAQGALGCVCAGKEKEWVCFFLSSVFSLRFFCSTPPPPPFPSSRHRPLHPGRRPPSPWPGGRVPGGRATNHACAPPIMEQLLPRPPR